MLCLSSSVQTASRHPLQTNRQHQYRPPSASHQPPTAPPTATPTATPNCHPQLPPPQLQTANSVFQPLSLQPSRLTPTPGVVQPLSLYCGKVFPPLECVLDLGLFISARTSAPRHARHHAHAHAHAHAGPPPISQTASSLPLCPRVSPCPTASTPPNIPRPAYDVPGAGTVPPDVLSPSPWVIQPVSAPRSF